MTEARTRTVPMRILALGCGNMGAAILSGLLRARPETAILAVDPDVAGARSRLPEGAGAAVVPNLSETGDWQPDIILLAVKPQQFAADVPAFRPEWRNALVISIMAGTPLCAIAGPTGASRLVRVMPNLPALIGKGMSIGFAADTINASDRETVSAISGAIGAFAWVAHEDQIDTGTAVSGSGPGYVFAFAEHFENAATAAGLPAELAGKLVAQTIAGAALMLAADDRRAADLKEMVSSRGGTTLAGLSILEGENGLPALLEGTVAAAARRARELSQG